MNDFATANERVVLDRMKRTMEECEYYSRLKATLPDFCQDLPSDLMLFVLLAVDEEMVRVGDAAIEAGVSKDTILEIDLFDAFERFLEKNPEIGDLAGRMGEFYLKEWGFIAEKGGLAGDGSAQKGRKVLWQWKN